MITIKKEKDIVLLREGGKRLATILAKVAAKVAPGVSTKELNDYAEELIRAQGDSSAFLDYQPWGAKRPFPASLCVSINDEVVHGIPNEGKKVLTEGDIVSLDLGLIHEGLITDHAVTVPVGVVSEEHQKFMDVTEEALNVGIKAARAGATTGDIGHAIETFTKPYKYGIIEELAGHGVGYAVHEDPYVPNYGHPGDGPVLKPGMVIAIEPMFTLGKPYIKLDRDGYTYRTKDGSWATHFEHTILITSDGPEILTKE
jgi:methionyl aminopeptidase